MCRSETTLSVLLCDGCAVVGHLLLSPECIVLVSIVFLFCGNSKGLDVRDKGLVEQKDNSKKWKKCAWTWRTIDGPSICS